MRAWGGSYTSPTAFAAISRRCSVWISLTYVICRGDDDVAGRDVTYPERHLPAEGQADDEDERDEDDQRQPDRRSTRSRAFQGMSSPCSGPCAAIATGESGVGVGHFAPWVSTGPRAVRGRPG